MFPTQHRRFGVRFFAESAATLVRGQRRVSRSMSVSRNESLKQLLKSKGFGSEAVRAIEAHGEWRQLDSGETFLDSGQTAGSLGILTSGAADVVGGAPDGGRVVVASVGRSDLVGWEALLDSQPTVFAICVRLPVHSWNIAAEALERLRQAEPQAAIGLADLALGTMRRIERESRARLSSARTPPKRNGLS